VQAYLLAGASLALAIGAAPTVSAAAGPASPAVWKVQRIAVPKIRAGRLTGVSCLSPSRCIAVGFYGDVPGNGTLAETWDGRSWSIQATPGPAGARAAVLEGVSCPAPGTCVAVGSYQNAAGKNVTLAEAWDGTSWSIQATPNPAGERRGSLQAVSCGSATACTATGSYQAAGGRYATLAEAWDGTSWSIQPTPSPSATRNTLSAVSCTSPTACIAVGAAQKAPDERVPLAEAWNGTTWSVQHMPSPPTGGTLSAVSCTTATACTAAGTVAEGWNGTSWHIEQTFPGAPLSGISCPSAGFCLAAGPEVEAWDGGSWSSVPGPAGAAASPLGVSCASASACTVVGYQAPVQPMVTLAEAWNGSKLSLQPTPNPAAVAASGLTGVSCPSAHACAAVGSFSDDSGALVPLAEAWAGAEWSIKPTPLPPDAAEGALTAVSCSSPSACTAVGWYADHTSGHLTLAETWNGTAWSVRHSPSPPATASTLNGVSCTSVGACTAVGHSGSSALAERWNGTSWSVQHGPDPAADSSNLAAVSCVSPVSCTAVGAYDNASGSHGLAWRWNGRTWSAQRIPDPPGAGNMVTVTGVSCTSAVACTAVGSSIGTAASHALAAAWNGTTWSLQPVPLPRADSGSSLAGVSCGPAAACTAVGFSIGTGASHALAAAWNGTTWSLQPAAAPAGSLASLFHGVSCVPAGPCTSVGGYANSVGTNLALAEARA
jgi:hypothetical protein